MLDIIHNSQELFYRSPFGAVECESVIDIKIRINKKHKVEFIDLNFLDDAGRESVIDMKLKDEENDFFIYCAKLDIPKIEGLYWYNFKIQADDIICYYGNNGLMLGGEGETFRSKPPLSYQITVYKKNNTTVDWIKDGIIYQIFPDRFYNGNEDNTVLKPIRDMILRSDWNDTPKYVKSDNGRMQFFDYFGGNLEGIIKKLPYLKELGVTIIYLNPIFEGSSNHKYDTGDYKKIDAMFGDEEKFIELCEKSKAQGIRIILDGVFSHTGSDSIYFNKYKKYESIGAYQSKDSKYYAWYDFEDYPNQYDSWWGVDALPNVDELNQGYLDYIINDEDSVVNKWSKVGISGWRLDVADELPDEFIKKFKKQLKTVDSESVLIGEVWEDASNKSSYGERRSYLLGEELDATMNYPFRNTFVDFLLGVLNSSMAIKELMSIYENYPIHHFYSLMNLVGTHDIPRIITVLGEAPEENNLSQREKEEFKLDEENFDLGFKRLKLLTLIQMTFPGVPSIYYGDEAGVEGYSDPINRKTYPWGNENKDILDWFKKVTSLRSIYDVFKTGSFTLMDLDSDVFVYMREIKDSKDVFNRQRKDNVAIVLINRSNVKKEIKLELKDKVIKELYSILDDESLEIIESSLNVELKPFGCKVLLKNR